MVTNYSDNGRILHGFLLLYTQARWESITPGWGGDLVDLVEPCGQRPRPEAPANTTDDSRTPVEQWRHFSMLLCLSMFVRGVDKWHCYVTAGRSSLPVGFSYTENRTSQQSHDVVPLGFRLRNNNFAESVVSPHPRTPPRRHIDVTTTPANSTVLTAFQRQVVPPSSPKLRWSIAFRVAVSPYQSVRRQAPSFTTSKLRESWNDASICTDAVSRDVISRNID